ncbi:hypothetical protein [Psychroflexus planctonicus]|uniref:Uncharacterized protein n=1 Tax=Psychroflexus planctonicus TaxID=1526575 RepID=A0ABQ1SEA4_9FLAO|nr:hypothetical protein [Psychroflexus planctonicus]GGE32365.1 hypothetical protein GCM10010832_10810 [Psychroflexus planctonicus]
MKILVLAENLEVNRTSSGITSNKNILMYQRYFNHVDVITSTPLNQFKQIEGVNYTKFTNSSKMLLEKIPKIAALPAYLNGLNFTARRIIEDWTQVIKSKLDKKNYSLIVSLGSGLSFVPAYAMLNIDKTLYGNYIMFVHDPYPSHQYPPPYKKKSTYLYKVQAKLFGKALSKADIISFPSLRLQEWMAQFYNLPIQKQIIQPHLGLNINELWTILPNIKTKKLPVYPDGINIIHTGTLLGPRTPTFLIEALKLLFEKHPESRSIVKLHIVGKMTKEWSEENLVAENVHIHSHRYTYQESLEIQKNADVLLLLEAVSDVSPFMPGKLADYLVADKPILALTPKQSETTRILGENYPLLVENGDVGEIYKKLVIIYKSYQEGSINELIPNKKARTYVRPEEWINSLKKTLT